MYRRSIDYAPYDLYSQFRANNEETGNTFFLNILVGFFGNPRLERIIRIINAGLKVGENNRGDPAHIIYVNPFEDCRHKFDAENNKYSFFVLQPQRKYLNLYDYLQAIRTQENGYKIIFDKLTVMRRLLKGAYAIIEKLKIFLPAITARHVAINEQNQPFILMSPRRGSISQPKQSLEGEGNQQEMLILS